MLAKHLWSSNSEDADIDTALARGLVTINQALQHDPKNHMMLGNQSYLEFLRAKHAAEPTDQAFRILRRAIEIGGDEARGFELADASVKKIPPDDEFIEMIHSCARLGAEFQRAE